MRVKLPGGGLITGYSAQIDVPKLGQTRTVFTEITLRNHHQNDFARFLATVEKIDSVIECHLVSGGYDYLVKLLRRESRVPDDHGTSARNGYRDRQVLQLRRAEVAYRQISTCRSTPYSTNEGKGRPAQAAA